MAIDTNLAEEVAELEVHARAAARDVLASGAEGAERAHAWSEPMARAFAELGTRGLWVPADCGGDDDLVAAVVAVEAFATGDAGGLLGADRPGPAAGVLRVLPDRGRARALAEAALDGGTMLATALIDAVDDVAAGFRVPWAPGVEVPHALVVAATDGVAVVDGGGVAAEPASASALWASGGVALQVVDGDAIARHPLDADDALVARAVPRLWAGAVLCGVGQAAVDYAVAYGRERIVFGLPVLGHQANAFDVAWATATLEAARTGLRAAACHLAAGRAADGGWLATLAWLEARDAGLRATDLGVQMLGGHGYIHDHPAQRWYREARMLVLLFGGADAALDDLADRALDAPDPLVA